MNTDKRNEIGKVILFNNNILMEKRMNSLETDFIAKGNKQNCLLWSGVGEKERLINEERIITKKIAKYNSKYVIERCDIFPVNTGDLIDVHSDKLYIFYVKIKIKYGLEVKRFDSEPMLVNKMIFILKYFSKFMNYKNNEFIGFLFNQTSKNKFKF